MGNRPFAGEEPSLMGRDRFWGVRSRCSDIHPADIIALVPQIIFGQTSKLGSDHAVSWERNRFPHVAKHSV
jgi:hypothetical protein